MGTAAEKKEKKLKGRACAACHKSKNKCVFSLPGQPRCDRCARLDKECVPHLSMQGKRKRPSVDGRSTGESSASSVPVISAPSGAPVGGAPPTSHASRQGGLSNQAQLIDLVESGTLGQLGSGLNLGAFQGSNVWALSQQLHANGALQSGASALLQAAGQTPTSAQSLTTLLGRALGRENIGSVLAGGGGSNIGGSSLSQADLLSGIDPAKLDLMMRHLANSSRRGSGSVNGGMNLSNQTASANTAQAPLGNNSLEAPTSALLMLAGSAVGAAGGGGIQGTLNNVGGTYNASSGATATANVMGYNVGAVSGDVGQASVGHVPASRSSSMGHGSSQMVTGHVGSAPESLLKHELKKQKKAQLQNGTPPSHLQYPSISLLRQDSTNDLARQAHRASGDNNMSRSSSAANLMTPEDAIGNHIARAQRRSGQKLMSLKNHYGLQCQIREWISMSLARRSFALLAKASALANRCGIHMDRILCGMCGVAHESEEGSNLGGRMNYLLATLLEPRSHQVIPVADRHMLVPHLSKDVLAVVGCQDCPNFRESEMRNRWILIRETRRGITRFYCSPAFERNVMNWTHISQIYEDNLADINSLIFVKDDFRKFLACNAHQISLHAAEGMKPKPVRAFKTKIRLLGRQWGQAKYSDPSRSEITKEMIQTVQEGNAMTLEMDLRFVSFPAMDKTTYYLEFFHHQRGANSSVGNQSGASWARNMSDGSLDKTGADAQQQSVSGGDKPMAPTERMVSKSPGNEDPPTFEEVIESEDWVGISDVLATGDIDDLITALLD